MARHGVELAIPIAVVEFDLARAVECAVLGRHLFDPVCGYWNAAWVLDTRIDLFRCPYCGSIPVEGGSELVESVEEYVDIVNQFGTLRRVRERLPAGYGRAGKDEFFVKA